MLKKTVIRLCIALLFFQLSGKENSQNIIEEKTKKEKQQKNDIDNKKKPDGEKKEKEETERESDNATTQKVPTLKMVVVGKKKKQSTFEADRSISVVTEDEISDESPRSAPEALMNSEGVFVQKTNHGSGSPIIRGLVGPQILLTVDGVRLNNSVYRSGPMQYFNLIDPLSLRQIEVLRGPGSVLYGADAMGGVINVLPRVAGIEFGINKTMFLNRFELADTSVISHVNVGGRVRDMKIMFGGSIKHFNNLYGGGGVGEQPHSGYNTQSVFTNFSLPFRGILSDWKISGAYFFMNINEAGRAEKLITSRKYRTYDNTDHLAYLRLKARLKKIRTDSELTLSYQRLLDTVAKYRVEQDLKTIQPERTTVDKLTVDTIGVDLKMETSLLRNMFELQYGSMYYHDMIDAASYYKKSEENYVPAYPDNSTYDNFGAYALINYNIFKKNKKHDLLVGGGYRLYGMRANAPGREGLSDTESSITIDEVNVDHLGHVFYGSIQYMHMKTMSVTFTFSQGFRSPNMQEFAMLGDAGNDFHIPNDNLGPEKSDTFELLTKLQFDQSNILANNPALKAVSIAVSGYYSIVHDLLAKKETTWNGMTQIDDETVFKKHVNSNQGIIRGVEFRSQFKFHKNITLLGKGTYTIGDQELADGSTQPMRRMPPFYYMANLRWDSVYAENIRGFAEAYIKGAAKQSRLHPDDISDVRIPDGGTDAWITYNLRGGVVYENTIKTMLALENITDSKYKYHGSGVWSPGFNLLLSLEITP